MLDLNLMSLNFDWQMLFLDFKKCRKNWNFIHKVNEKLARVALRYYQIPSILSAIIFPCPGIRPDALRDLNAWPAQQERNLSLLHIKFFFQNFQSSITIPFSWSASSSFINRSDSVSIFIASWSVDPFRKVRTWAADVTEEAKFLLTGTCNDTNAAG